MKISILGCGRWGTFLAWYFNKIGYDVLLWGRKTSDKLRSLQDERENAYVKLADTIQLSYSLEQALSFSKDIVIAIDEQNLRNLMENILKSNYKDNNIILSMKGLENKTGKRLSEVANEYLLNASKIAILCGPGHPSEIVRGIPTCMMVDSSNETLKKQVAKNFSSDLIQFHIGTDLVGNEVGAAAKNVIGIAAGILDGIGLSSLKGILMVIGTKEIAELIYNMGGNAASVYGLSCLGDYQSTLFSEHSNSVSFGIALAHRKQFTKHVPGIDTSNAIIRLCAIYNLQLPLLYNINKIINNEADCTSLVEILLQAKD